MPRRSVDAYPVALPGRGHRIGPAAAASPITRRNGVPGIGQDVDERQPQALAIGL